MGEVPCRGGTTSEVQYREEAESRAVENLLSVVGYQLDEMLLAVVGYQAAEKLLAVVIESLYLSHYHSNVVAHVQLHRCNRGVV